MSSTDPEELTLGTFLAFAGAMVVIAAAIITTGGLLYSFPMISDQNGDATTNGSDDGSATPDEREHNRTANGTSERNTSDRRNDTGAG